MTAKTKAQRHRWYRYRDKWAWGYGEWQYDEVSVETCAAYGGLAKYIDEVHERNDWSDKYRGFDCEYVDVKALPVGHLAEAAAAAAKKAARLTETARRYKKQLARLHKKVSS